LLCWRSSSACMVAIEKAKMLLPSLLDSILALVCTDSSNSTGDYFFVTNLSMFS
jgi:hypothetical protein